MGEVSVKVDGEHAAMIHALHLLHGASERPPWNASYERTHMQPQRLVGLVVLIGGVVLLVMGIRETDSFSSQVSKFFTNSPTDRAIWLIIGGVAAIIAGGACAARSCRACVR